MRHTYVFPVVTVFTVCALLMSGCGTGDQSTSETADDPAAIHRFDPSSAAIGDSILGFRIESLDVQRSLADSAGWVGTIQFEGNQILEGTYRRHPFDPELAELCFFPDENSALRLPIFPNDERTSWLCFSNQEEAQEKLGPLSDVGTAAIEIDRFRYHYAHSDVYNTARLVRVVSPEHSAEPLANPRVDSSGIQSFDEAASWAYRQEASADLTGDGQAERVVIASDVVLNTAGTPLWEDGHRWVVYVESPAGERTLLYSAFVPNGFAEAAVVRSDSEDRWRVLVQERSPGQVRSFDIEYTAPGVIHMPSDSRYEVLEWLPGSARMQ